MLTALYAKKKKEHEESHYGTHVLLGFIFLKQCYAFVGLEFN